MFAQITVPDTSETITYAADSVSYSVDDSTLVLSGNTTIKYENITLTAGRVRFDTRTEILTAEGGLDSSTGRASNQLPTLQDPQGTLVGDRMIYSIRTKRGRIFRGRTQYEQGFFEGEQIRMDAENILNVDSGRYTTCNLTGHEHYHLRSKQLKIIPNDKAIVRSVVGYLGPVPVFYVPFYVLPLKRGRHSGFTMPTYGTGATEGTYVRNVGYYWAGSEYWDFKLSGDFSANQGMFLRPALRYAQTRRLNGLITGSYRSGYDFHTTGWDVQASHWQEVRPDLRVSGRGEFANSLSFVQSTTRGTDPGRLQRALRSNFSVDKTWGQKSLNLTVSETSSLTGKLVRPTTTLSLRLPTRPIIAPTQRRRLGGLPSPGSQVPDRLAPPRWYQSILYGYNATILDQKKGTTQTRQDLTQRFNLSSQQTLGGWFRMQPRSDYTEMWVRETRPGRSDSLGRQGAYNAGLQANTTLYGLFQPHLGRLQAIRHVVTPSLSFTQSGQDRPLQRFAVVSRSVNFTLANVLQAKTLKGESERKFDLLFVNVSSGYNFQATTRKLADLLTSVRIPARSVNVDANFTHDFYEPDMTTLRPPWLKSVNVTTSINLHGQGGAGFTPGLPVSGLPGQSVGLEGQGYFDAAGGPGRSASAFGNDRFDERFDQIKGPWTVTVTHRYTISRLFPAAGFRTGSHLANTSARFSLASVTDAIRLSNRLTRSVRVEHSMNYDIRLRRFVSQTFSFYRDLHCWEMVVRWTPTGFGQGVYFRLNIKAHPEIKIERQSVGG
ncbi:MAG: LPS-assembly protein LptD [Candidatus Latescibacteria bacterium]|nr:LPS-assembly protein LptD [Candidatus Latescibacterota bacterium]